MTRNVVTPVLTFLKRLKNIGLLLILLAVAVIAVPFKLPAYVVSAAEYVALVGAVMIVIAMVTGNSERPGAKSKTGTKNTFSRLIGVVTFGLFW